MSEARIEERVAAQKGAKKKITIKGWVNSLKRWSEKKIGFSQGKGILGGLCP